MVLEKVNVLRTVGLSRVDMCTNEKCDYFDYRQHLRDFFCCLIFLYEKISSCVQLISDNAEAKTM